MAEVVVPVALAVKREQLAHELWHYKYDADATVRGRLQLRLAAVLWRFLGEHEECVAGACSIPGFDIVTTVPGTQSRDDPHPLVNIAGTIVGQTRDRFEPLLAPGGPLEIGDRTVRADRYRATRQLGEHPAVLLIDDTWTTGGHALSAALTLRDAGASTIATVVIGRYFDRAFGPGEAYYRLARGRRFTWDKCCLEFRGGAVVRGHVRQRGVDVGRCQLPQSAIAYHGQDRLEHVLGLAYGLGDRAGQAVFEPVPTAARTV